MPQRGNSDNAGQRPVAMQYRHTSPERAKAINPKHIVHHIQHYTFSEKPCIHSEMLFFYGVLFGFGYTQQPYQHQLG